MSNYSEVVNSFRIKCPDGTYREPTPNEVNHLVKSCAHISLTGERSPSCPALRAAERNGHLSDAIHLRRLNADAAHLTPKAKMQTYLDEQGRAAKIATLRIVLKDLYHRKTKLGATCPSAMISVRPGVSCQVYTEGDDIGLRALKDGKQLWDDGVTHGWLQLCDAHNAEDADWIDSLALKVSDIITQE